LRESNNNKVCFDLDFTLGVEDCDFGDFEERRLTLAYLAWYRFGESGRSFEEAFSQLVGLICWESFSQLAVRPWPCHATFSSPIRSTT
jgi:hypothetical protein